MKQPDDKQVQQNLLAMLKDELNGKNEGLQFFLKNKQFYWKKSGQVYTRTKQIYFKIVEDVQAVSQFVQDVMNYNSNAGISIKNLVHENENLKNRCSEMEEMLNVITEKKREMERELYTKFVLILNAKKEKIILLKNELKDKEALDNGYQDKTDDDDDDDTNDGDTSGSFKRKIKEEEPAPSTSGIVGKKQKFNDESKSEKPKAKSKSKPGFDLFDIINNYESD